MAKNPLSSILETHRLTGNNYPNWLRSIRVILAMEERLYVLDERPLSKIANDPSDEDKVTYVKWKKDDVVGK